MPRPWLIVALLACAGCGPGVGHADVSSECSSVDQSGQCSVTIKSIAERTYHHRVNDRQFPPAGGVEVLLSLTTASGPVRVWVVTADGERETVAEPGRPAVLKAVARVETSFDERWFEVHFRPVGDQAEDVRADIHYSVR